MLTYSSVDEYQIEITTYCNAACPQCPRNLCGYGKNPYMPLVHLDADILDRAFPEDLCQRLRQVFFCGSYGDPIMHPKFLDILRTFRQKNPTLWLYFHTNGGVHNEDYWQEVADIMAGYGQIDFGIDGLSDTLDLYRRNVDYDKVIRNARAFIDRGGRAQWNYIVFKHNEHQVEQAKQLAQEYGFFNILIRKTGRFFDHKNLVEFNSWPVYNSKDDVAYQLELPTQEQYRNNSMLGLTRLKTEYPDIKDYFAKTEIRCDAEIGNKVAVNAEGVVLPCNFFNHNLYDLRFHNTDTLPRANALSGQPNQVKEFLDQYGLNNLSIKNNSLADIFDNKFWQDLHSSFTGNRLFECAMTCGKRLTKVWDQGGNRR